MIRGGCGMLGGRRVDSSEKRDEEEASTEETRHTSSLSQRVVASLKLYSALSACIGSMRAARHAGMSEAALAISASAATEPTMTQGSRAEVP